MCICKNNLVQSTSCASLLSQSPYPEKIGWDHGKENLFVSADDVRVSLDFSGEDCLKGEDCQEEKAHSRYSVCVCCMCDIIVLSTGHRY